MLGDVALGGADDVEGVAFALLAGLAPGRDAVSAQDDPERFGVGVADGGDVESQLEARTAPGRPQHLVAEDGARQGLAVRGGRQRDARVGVQVVDVLAADQSVHGGVDRRRGAPLAEEAVIEGRHHLVFEVGAAVDLGQVAHGVETQRRETREGQGAEVAARALDPHHVDLVTTGGVLHPRLGAGVAAGVVGHRGVGPQTMGAFEEFAHGGGGLVGEVGHQAPQPAACPPTRSLSILA